MPLQFDADEQELQLFLAETEEHLQALDQNVVQLENRPDDQELLGSIFRSAHTIKGGAGLIGHQRMAELAHAMENVLDGLRARRLFVNPATIDALLSALDALRILNAEVADLTPRDIPLESIMTALAACLNPSALAPASAHAEHGLATENPKADLAGWELDDELAALVRDVPAGQLYDVYVAADPECGIGAARIFQAHMEIVRATRVLRTNPTLDEIEKDENVTALRALIALEGPAGLLEHALGGIADILEARVNAVTVEATDAVEDTARDTAPLAAPAITETPREEAVRVASAPEKPATPAPATGAGAEEGPRVAAGAGAGKGAEGTVRIAVGIVDDLMNLVSELVLGRTRLQTLRAQLQARYPGDEGVDNLEDAVGHIDRISSDLQATVMKARMLPVENVFNKFPRLMRDLAAHSGKKVRFSMSGQDTELDRSVIEQLSDPLVHLLRNSIDHGMETPEARVAAGKPEIGSIALSATPDENHIVIEVSDDGPGIDGERVKAKAVAKGLLSAEAAERLSEREAQELVFLPGLSTAPKITDISGRGVGMDIVKSTIERMGGQIHIDSTPGAGTTFSITLPLTLAIMQALLVAVDDAVYALPLNTVTEIVSVPDDAVHMLQGTEATLLRGTILPLLRLRGFFGRAPAPAGSTLHVVATRVDGQPLGLVVDRFMGEQEIVVKPLGTYMGKVDGLAGATILGDGRIGLLVDVAALKAWTPPATTAAA